MEYTDTGLKLLVSILFFVGCLPIPAWAVLAESVLLLCAKISALLTVVHLSIIYHPY